MSDADTTGTEDEKESKGLIADISAGLNTKAGRKLADAVAGLVELPRIITELVAGPDRLLANKNAKAKATVLQAHSEAEASLIKAQAEQDRLRLETGKFVYDREMRKTVNRRAIVAEAQKALPSSEEEISEEPVSQDFVHSFFEEFDGISDPEVHKIAGRLLAGEVARPGSFPRRTMRVLSDMESSEFRLFAALCRFSWAFGLFGRRFMPLVFDVADSIYLQNGLNFESLQELDSLGLISFNSLTGFSQNFKEIDDLIVTTVYGPSIIDISLKDKGNKISIGNVILTDAGKRLLPLTNAEIIPEFTQYVIEKWQADGHKIRLNGVWLEKENEKRK